MQQIFSNFGSNLWSFFIGAFSLLLLWGAARALEWAWFKPRRLDRMLRKQGLRGTVYRPIVGDIKENSRLNKESHAKPMALSHDIAARVAPLFHQTMKEFGSVSFTWFGPDPRVTVGDPDLVREIMATKFGHYEKQLLGSISRWLGNGLTSHEGEKWAKHRRILNPAFHVDKLKRMLPAFSTCCDELVDRWENSVGPEGSFERDIWLEMQNLTGDVISKAAFGSSYQEGRRIFQLQCEQLELLNKVFTTLLLPFSWCLPTKSIKRMNKNASEIQTLLMGIIAKREKAIKNGETTIDDLLGLLLEANMSEMWQNGKSDTRSGMTIGEVIEECKVFYFAGMETTSILLTWTMVVLSMHPEWQEKAREEVFKYFGTEKPDFDGLNRLKTVTMILYEVLRLYPPVVTVSRRTYKTMPLGDLLIPPGVRLAVPIVSIHHDPEIWGPDVTEFKPTRFAEGISKAAKNGKVAFFPFGWGPRICIGQNFALLEAKMGLSMILQYFRFELSDKYQHAPYTVFTLRPEHGVPIKFHKI